MPVISCDELQVLTEKEQPMIAYFGNPTKVRGPNGKLSFLPHIHQANMMSFSIEQKRFVAVPDQNCMRKLGFSAKDEDWTLAFYAGNGT